MIRVDVLTLVACAFGLVGFTTVSAPTSRTAPPRSMDRPISTAATSVSALSDNLAAVLQEVGPADRVPITVVMSRQASQTDIGRAAANAEKSLRRAQVVAELKRVATEGQADLLESIRHWQAQGEVSTRVRPLWIHSVVALEATPAVIRAIAQRPDVARVNYDQRRGLELFPVDPGFDDVGGFGGGNQSLNGAGEIECGVELMRAPDVWSDFGLTGEGVVVGVIDTGICLTHPDLVNQIWQNPNEIPGNGIDDDNNGYIDDTVGWNFEHDTNDVTDTNSHGTHVSGTVAGDGTNGVQTGMAPDALIMTLKFFNNLAGESTVWEAMQYGTENGADVLTASLGWRHAWNPDRVTWRTICENSIAAGVVVLYAAGNEGDCCNPVDNVRTPGDVPDVITIGATNCADNAANFSSRGPVTWEGIQPWNDWPYPPGKIKPTVSAPGVSTVSTSNNCSGYTEKSGTSMATPHVAGAVALLLQANPNLDHFDVMSILEETAVDLGEVGYDNVYGAGRVDAYEAVLLALSTGATTTLTDFAVAFGSHISGGLDELLESDDERLVARSRFGFTALEPNLMLLDVGFETSVEEPETLSLSIESRIDHPAGMVTLRLKNVQNLQKEIIDTYAINQTEAVHTLNDLPAHDRVDSQGRVELEIKHVVVAVFTATGFSSSFDRIALEVE